MTIALNIAAIFAALGFWIAVAWAFVRFLPLIQRGQRARRAKAYLRLVKG
jgi:hypothetical protein